MRPNVRTMPVTSAARSILTSMSVTYLRLSHNDSHLNWTFSSWLSCLPYILTALALEYSVLLLIRRIFMRNTSEGAIQLPINTTKVPFNLSKPSYLSSRMLLVYTFLYMPLFVTLFFASGKPASLSPAAGVHRLPYLTNTPAYSLLFPSESAENFSLRLLASETGSVEDVLSRYAEQHAEPRVWTITPSVVQPISQRHECNSRRGAALEDRLRREGGRTVAGRRRLAEISREARTRSAVFETMKREDLEAEHLAALN